MTEGGSPLHIALRLASRPSETVTLSMRLLDTALTRYDRRGTIELGFRSMTNATTSADKWFAGDQTVTIRVNPEHWELDIVMRFRMIEDDIVDTKGPIAHQLQYGHSSNPTVYTGSVQTVDNDVPRLVLRVPRAPPGRLSSALSVTHSKHVFPNHIPYAVTLYEPSTVLAASRVQVDPSASAVLYASLDKRIRAQTLMMIDYVDSGSGIHQVQISDAQIVFSAMEVAGTWHAFSVYANQNAQLTGTHSESLKVSFTSDINAATCSGTPSLCSGGSAALAIEVVEHSKPGLIVSERSVDDQATDDGAASVGITLTVEEGASSSLISGTANVELSVMPTSDVSLTRRVYDDSTGEDVTNSGLVVVTPASWIVPFFRWDAPMAVSVAVLSDGIARVRRGAVAKTFTVRFECASLDDSFHGYVETTSVLRISVTESDTAEFAMSGTVTGPFSNDQSTLLVAEGDGYLEFALSLTTMPTASVSANVAVYIGYRDAGSSWLDSALSSAASRTAMRALVAAKAAKLAPSARVTGVSGIQSSASSSASSLTFTFRAGELDTAVGRVYYDRDYYATGRLELSVNVAATSSDNLYDGLTEKLWFAMEDADTPEFTVTPTSPTIDEDATTAQITVALAAKPLTPIWVVIDSPFTTSTQQLELTPGSQSGSGVTGVLDSETGRMNSMISFDDSTYSTPQTVMYKAIDDRLFEQIHSGTLSLTAAIKNNVAPNDCLIGYAVGMVPVRIIDDDLARLTEVVSSTSVETQTMILNTGVSAAFPPGALAGTTTQFDISELRAQDLSAPPNAAIFTTQSSIVEFKPSTSFNNPVTLSLPLTTSSTLAATTVHFIGASSVDANDW
jgi:polyisoprenoid-binding protein YceI